MTPAPYIICPACWRVFVRAEYAEHACEPREAPAGRAYDDNDVHRHDRAGDQIERDAERDAERYRLAREDR